MDAKTLSVIMGHYSVSFTLDTYAHVLNGHKQEAVALLKDLFTAQPAPPQNFAYPLIITTQEDGLLFELPDFPQIRLEHTDSKAHSRRVPLRKTGVLPFTMPFCFRFAV